MYWWRPIKRQVETPPYLVMKACGGLGFQTPLKVCWWRMSHFLHHHGSGRTRLGARLWEHFFGSRSRKGVTCTCGQPLPALKGYKLKVLFEPETQYLLGQCRRCRTVYWDTEQAATDEPRAGAWLD